MGRLGHHSDMSIAEKWKSQDMIALAADWLREIRGSNPRAVGDIRDAVVLMNFTAPAEIQWAFLQAAVDSAETDDELYAIAAGPFEHLLGFHGAQYIKLVESRCHDDAKFARLTTAAYQHTMSEDVWSRVQAIQAGAHDPL